MSLEVGQKIKGKVVSVRNFGAFVELENNQTGMIHISEVSDGFVKDINDYVSAGDEIEVRVIKITDDGKINLSMRGSEEKSSARAERNERPQQRPNTQSRSQQEDPNDNFDNLMNQFLRDSEDRLSSLRRNTEGKRGGRGGRRN